MLFWRTYESNGCHRGIVGIDITAGGARFSFICHLNVFIWNDCSLIFKLQSIEPKVTHFCVFVFTGFKAGTGVFFGAQTRNIAAHINVEVLVLTQHFIRTSFRFDKRR